MCISDLLKALGCALEDAGFASGSVRVGCVSSSEGEITCGYVTVTVGPDTGSLVYGPTGPRLRPSTTAAEKGGEE